MTRTAWLLLPLLAACNKDKDQDSNPPDDSGSPDTDPGDTDTGTDACTVSVVSTSPTAGATGVYYRAPVVVSFDGDAVAAGADIQVLDPSGYPALADYTWSDGNVQAEIALRFPAPNTEYELVVVVCDKVSSVHYTTSDLGTPLAEGSASLVGRTYVFTLADANITTPAFLDALAGQYLTVPLLFYVTAADDATIDFLGALGYLDAVEGTYYQVDLPTWDFPAGNFSASPFFSAQAEYITIMYDVIPIPIEGFYLEGAFTSDGYYIREGLATGKADTRYMAELIGQPADAYSAVCDFAALAGVYCEPCADGESYCLYIEAEDIEAVYVDGLSLVEIAE